jgi:hypothetical protein
MRAHLLGVDSPAWHSFLATARHDFYHLPAYVALSAEQDGGEPAALYVREGDRAMLLPLIIRPIPGGGRDATSPYGYPGPLVSGPDDGFLERALQAGIGLLASRGIVSVFVRLHPLLNRVAPKGIGDVVRAGETVTIDLTLPEKELWQQTRANHRGEISRAIRAGRVVLFDDAWIHADAFGRLYRETMLRVSADPFYFFGDAYFSGLRAALGERLRLCVVEADGVLAAAGLFVETCGIVQYHLSAMDPAFAREGLTKLMIHSVRSWAKERGDRDLHLGGGVGGAEDPLFDFKSRFSPGRLTFRTLRIVVDQVQYAQLVKRQEEGHAGVQMPAGGAPVEGGVGFFPAYRAPGR